MAAALLTRLLVPGPRAMPALLGRHTGLPRGRFAARHLVDLFTFYRLHMKSMWSKTYLGARLLT